MPEYQKRYFAGVLCTRTACGGWEWSIGPYRFLLQYFGGYLRMNDKVVHETDPNPARMVPWSLGYVAGYAACAEDFSGRE